MIQRVKRESLVAKVVEVLKSELPRYRGQKWLPGEQVLSRQFQVSRTTIRAALAQMQRLGLIRVFPKRGYRILLSARGHSEQTSRVIGFLQGACRDMLDAQTYGVVHDIEHGLNVAGYELIIHSDVPLRGCHREQWLEHLLHTQCATCWMLHAVSFETQQWFMRRGHPAFIFGSCYKGIQMPNLDVDYGAVCRHAAGLLWRLGHRRICLLAPQTRFGGDVYGEEGFRSAIIQLGRGLVPADIRRHNGSVGSIQRILDACRGGPSAPTAFLVAKAMHALTAMTHLIYRGISVPQEVSLVCRDDDEFMHQVVPSMAHYRVDWSLHARRCVRMLIQLATAGYLKRQERMQMAQFIHGETVASPKFGPSG